MQQRALAQFMIYSTIVLVMLQEELAAVNLAKYRKAQKELEEAEERADQAEVNMSRMRAKNRTSVSVTKTPTVSFIKALCSKGSSTLATIVAVSGLIASVDRA